MIGKEIQISQSLHPTDSGGEGTRHLIVHKGYLANGGQETNLRGNGSRQKVATKIKVLQSNQVSELAWNCSSQAIVVQIDYIKVGQEPNCARNRPRQTIGGNLELLQGVNVSQLHKWKETFQGSAPLGIDNVQDLERLQ